MRMLSLLIGVTVVLLTACKPQTPAADVSQPTLSGAAMTDSEFVSPNETTPKTIDSLEVKQPSPILTVTKLSDSVLLGDAGLPRLTIYDDYGCYYCQEFALSELPWILETYGARLAVERIFTPMSPAGTVMAKTALCAEKQGKFMEADLALHTKPIATAAEATLLAKNLKLHTATFTTCMAAKQTTDELEAMASRSQTDGIDRVPSFASGNDRWIGILSREDLQKKIENAI